MIDEKEEGEKVSVFKLSISFVFVLSASFLKKIEEENSDDELKPTTNKG